MSRNNEEHIRGNLLDFSYHHYYKLINTNLSRQTNTSTPQQINFTGKLKEYDGATMKSSKKLF